MSDSKGEPKPRNSGITRSNLELVIRRAAELAETADVDENLSDDEVLRIAAELGLPARSVRQAMYEVPAQAPVPSWAQKVYGPDAISGTRAVKGDASVVMARLENHLSAREFMQIRRRQQDTAVFMPADDTISTMVRLVFRSGRRFHIARTPQVTLQVRPLEQGWSHVRLDLDIAERRRDAITQGVLGGAVVGLGLGVGAALAAAGLTVGSPGLLAPAFLLFSGLAGFGVGFGGVLASTVAKFRRWVNGANDEVAALLDRAERGESLAPPPAPWWRRVQQKMG